MIEYKKEDLLKVKEDLLNSKIVAFPTDTVFGLACLSTDDVSKDKIYEAKNRSIDKKLPMMVSDIKMLEQYCEINEKIKILLNKFTPGPITLIMKYINSNETVAVRIPNDEWILELIKEIGKPLLVTSANISGSGSLIKYEDVKAQIGDKVDAIVIGDAKGEKASTIVDCINDFKILRKGPISKDEIDKALLIQ